MFLPLYTAKSLNLIVTGNNYFSRPFPRSSLSGDLSRTSLTKCKSSIVEGKPRLSVILCFLLILSDV